MGPLAKIKVVEIGGIGPGPVAGMMLADLGADVVLVERASANPNAIPLDQGKVGTELYKRGKRSIALDLKNPRHVEVVLSLVAQADLLIEGFRPGVMERLGLGPDVCLQRNPKLVYGRMTGWGQNGPLAQAAGHDLNYLSISGAVHYSGLPGSVPFPTPTIVGDVASGAMSLVLGLLSAQIHAAHTGQGQVVDAAICDGAIYNLALLASFHAQGALGNERGESFVTGGAHWAQTYACADGRYITVQAAEPDFYALLVKLCELEGDADFARQYDRRTWPQAREKMAALFASKTRAQWCELLEGTDACFAPVLNMAEAAEYPHNQARGNFIKIGDITQPAPAPKFGATPQAVGVPPRMGQHAQEILQSLGLGAEALAELKGDGVF
ncbi:MAG: CaiB/BaiF CoA-transferase family protein [Pseudoxanthomonas sp.]